MWRPWSKGLELLGRIRLRAPFRWRRTLRVGDPNAPDAMASTGWREYLDAERLYDVWGPHPESAWSAFHCVPLFAALDSLRHAEIGPARLPEPGDPKAWPGEFIQTVEPMAPPADSPAPQDPFAPRPPELVALPPGARQGAPPPPWLTRDTWTILDLPGPRAVEAAVWLVEAAGCQPVCTFDNWPHPKGVLKAEHVLAELLRWATTMAVARRSLDPSAPPVWICDSERLGRLKPRPGDFDNRYYLDDSILPGVDLLRRAGLRRAIYVTAVEKEPLVDLDGYFRDLIAAGFGVLQVTLSDPALEPSPLRLPAVPRMPPSDFRRSGAGGFGQDVPHPSSGGGGG
jgi:hypothetical protein